MRTSFEVGDREASARGAQSGPGRAGRLLLAAAGVLFALALSEIALRVVESQTGPLFYSGFGVPEYDPRFVQESPVLGVEHRANANHRIVSREHEGGAYVLRTNNLGLRRDSDSPVVKPAAVRNRVLVLGDSQTDGLVNNTESWPANLERLAGGATTGLEVLNAGVISYQPFQEYLWWRIYGRALRPDVVLLGYYVGNDMAYAGGDRIFKGEDSGWRIDESPRQPPNPSPLRLILQSCRICGLAGNALRGGPLEDLAQNLGLAGTIVEREMNTRYLTAHRLCAGCTWQSIHQARLLAGNPQQYERELAATRHILQLLRDEVTADGGRLVVVLIPTKLQIESDVDGRVARVAALLGVPIQTPYFEDRVMKDVRVTAAELGIVAVDTTAGMRAAYAETKSSLYYTADWHLNVSGNAALAKAVYADAAVRRILER